MKYIIWIVTAIVCLIGYVYPMALLVGTEPIFKEVWIEPVDEWLYLYDYIGKLGVLWIWYDIVLNTKERWDKGLYESLDRRRRKRIKL